MEVSEQLLKEIGNKFLEGLPKTFLLNLALLGFSGNFIRNLPIFFQILFSYLYCSFKNSIYNFWEIRNSLGSPSKMFSRFLQQFVFRNGAGYFILFISAIGINKSTGTEILWRQISLRMLLQLLLKDFLRKYPMELFWNKFYDLFGNSCKLFWGNLSCYYFKKFPKDFLRNSFSIFFWIRPA